MAAIQLQYRRQLPVCCELFQLRQLLHLLALKLRGSTDAPELWHHCHDVTTDPGS